MPTWDERLTPAEIRTLALYVHDLGNAAAMTGAAAKPSRRKGWLAWVLVPAGLLLVAGANAHLVYVAFDRSRNASRTLKAAGEGQRLPRRQVRLLKEAT